MLNLNSKKSFGKIEPYVPDDIAPRDISVPPLGTPVSESGIETGNSNSDGIYTAFISPVTHEDRTRMEKRIQPVIEEHEQDTSFSWLSRAIGIIVGLAAMLIGFYVLWVIVDQMPQLTSTNWMP